MAIGFVLTVGVAFLLILLGDYWGADAVASGHGAGQAASTTEDATVATVLGDDTVAESEIDLKDGLCC
eukprot:CAMPEP_0194322020 /NCGR_PEP_ID=MMETSP0171-20130528/18222_1 /TAXON_ID=218684 /ORGANISM="Corethron pennatum, Strain L29A3" /LENGTH=67 /DNA_ID=CAMNT_0039080151 /DNA_START=195 /DNA_END=398 /DNA_ORIENTATION=-